MRHDHIDDLPAEDVAQCSRSRSAAFERAFDRAQEHGRKEGDALREAYIDARHAADRT